MGKQSTTPSSHRASALLWIALLLLLVLGPPRAVAQTATSAATIPLLLPSAIVFDAAGNLYIAETANHVIRKVDTTGNLTTIAGDATQGYSGDNGPATAAQLDSPQGLALDANQNLYIADTHNHRIRKLNLATGIITTIAGTGTAGFTGDNAAATNAQLDLPTALAADPAGNLYLADTQNHRIRRIDAATGQITSIAGNGTQGFTGDSGPATAASIDSPTGIAVDASGNIYLADTHNQRIRRIDAATGQIITIAGTGSATFTGDNAAATNANLALPHGLTIDATGNLYLADTQNHRIRRIDAATGIITTIAGDGTQAFAGDNGPATAASLNSPRAVVANPVAPITLADTGNQRIRQLDSEDPANIHTIPSPGVATPETLTLSAPPVITYGTGQITASLAPSTAAPNTPATGPITFLDLTNGIFTTLGTATLTANTTLFSTATLSAGTHTITATYAGDATHAPAQSAALLLTITPAPALITLTSSADAEAGQRLTITTHVASTTSGTPTGTVTLLDGAATLADVTLSPTGDVTYTTASFTPGYHSITATYSGDGNFTPATSSLAIIQVGTGPAAPDFTFTPTGTTNQTITAGSSATFTFTVATQGSGTLASPITLAASGLPPLATASFNPAYLPPGAATTTFILTIATPKSTALERTPKTLPVTLALLFFPIASLTLRRKHRGKAATLLAFTIVTVALALCSGCGNRVRIGTLAQPTATPYTITVTGTATTSTGTILQHTTTVILTMQPTN